ncbi:unnamed protein product [Tetraodon nigroviridis]|uniref:(spotted green pufferfish) hypothetical protein n=1 Tax=Tetraodon nigroviridis TaxID=99883 RepID=Q4RRS1_TETNG|nr:unnamed protein product [Tetraodon nigroviridis]
MASCKQHRHKKRILAGENGAGSTEARRETWQTPLFIAPAEATSRKWTVLRGYTADPCGGFRWNPSSRGGENINSLAV